MKLLHATLILLFLVSCTPRTDERILGVWDVESDFYTATYNIEWQEEILVGKLLYYNDNTRILRQTGTDKDIVFHNLRYKNGIFVDAISGATRKQKSNVAIKIKHLDTLEVTTYIEHQPLQELWIRKK